MSGICVCMSVCLRYKRKTNWAINSKLGRRMLSGRHSACIDPEVKRSRSRGYQVRCRHVGMTYWISIVYHYDVLCRCRIESVRTVVSVWYTTVETRRRRRRRRPPTSSLQFHTVWRRRPTPPPPRSTTAWFPTQSTTSTLAASSPPGPARYPIWRRSEPTPVRSGTGPTSELGSVQMNCYLRSSEIAGECGQWNRTTSGLAPVCRPLATFRLPKFYHFGISFSFNSVSTISTTSLLVGIIRAWIWILPFYHQFSFSGCSGKEPT